MAKKRFEIKFTHEGEGYIATECIGAESGKWTIRRSEDYETTFFAKMKSISAPDTATLRMFVSAYDQGFDDGKKHIRDKFKDLMID